MYEKIKINGLEIEGNENFVSNLLKNLLTKNNDLPKCSLSKKGRPRLNSGIRGKILAFLEQNKGNSFSAKEISSMVHLSDNTVSPALTYLSRSGFVFRNDRDGRYVYSISSGKYLSSSYYPKGGF